MNVVLAPTQVPRPTAIDRGLPSPALRSADPNLWVPTTKRTSGAMSQRSPMTTLALGVEMILVPAPTHDSAPTRTFDPTMTTPPQMFAEADICAPPRTNIARRTPNQRVSGVWRDTKFATMREMLDKEAPSCVRTCPGRHAPGSIRDDTAVVRDWFEGGLEWVRRHDCRPGSGL